MPSRSSKFDFSFIKRLDSASRGIIEKSLIEIQGLSLQCFNSDYFQCQFRVPLFHSLQRTFTEHKHHYKGRHPFAFENDTQMIQKIYFIIENKIGEFFSGFKKFEGIVSVDIEELKEVIEKNKEMRFIQNTVNQGEVVIKMKKQSKGTTGSKGLTPGTRRESIVTAKQVKSDVSGKEKMDSFEVVDCPLALTENRTLEESLKELDRVLQAELISFDRVKNMLFVFDTYFLGNFSLDSQVMSAKSSGSSPAERSPEFGKHLRNLTPKSENKLDWFKRKGVAGIFNAMIVMTQALDSLEKMDFFSKGGPLFFARESARMCFTGSSGTKSRLKSIGRSK